MTLKVEMPKKSRDLDDCPPGDEGKAESSPNLDNYSAGDADYDTGRHPELSAEEEREIYRVIEKTLFAVFHELSAVGLFTDYVMNLMEDLQKGKDHPRRMFAMEEEVYKEPKEGGVSPWEAIRRQLVSFVSQLHRYSGDVDRAWFECSTFPELMAFLEPDCKNSPVSISHDRDGLLRMEVTQGVLLTAEAAACLDRYIQAKTSLSRAVTLVPLESNYLENVCTYMLEKLDEYRNTQLAYTAFKADLARNPDMPGLLGRNEHFHYNFSSIFNSARMFPGNMWETQRRLNAHIRLVDEQRGKVIVCSQGLVKIVLSRYRNLSRSAGISMHDLFGEGRAGLMKAMQTFDYRRGNRFSTYAQKWVSNHVHMYLSLMGHAMKLPVHDRKILLQMRQYRNRILDEKSREPTPEEIAIELKVPLNQIKALMPGIVSSVSLESPLEAGGEGDDRTLKDSIHDPDAMSPVSATEQYDSIEVIKGLWRRLDKREQDFLAFAHGAFGYPKHNLEQIGMRYELTRERVRQIVAEAEKKMRSMMARIEKTNGMKLGSISMLGVTPPVANDDEEERGEEVERTG